MRSKITIEVDFENNNRPVLQILSRNSDDVRDRLISSFIQGLNHTSRWCTIAYMGNFEEGQEQTHRWHIVPIKPSELETESNLMKATVEYIETGKHKISEQSYLKFISHYLKQVVAIFIYLSGLKLFFMKDVIVGKDGMCRICDHNETKVKSEEECCKLHDDTWG